MSQAGERETGPETSRTPRNSRIRSELLSNIFEFLRRYQSFDHIYLEFEIILGLFAAWFYGHRKISPWTLIIALGALVYVLSPIDIIPDVIPILGYVDDLYVIRLFVRSIQKEIGEYRVWRGANEHVNVYGPPPAHRRGGGSGLGEGTSQNHSDHED